MSLVRPLEISEVFLSKGQVTIVDAYLFGYLSQWKWHAAKQQCQNHEKYYAVRAVWNGGKTDKVAMHHQVLMYYGIEAEVVDHKNGDRLDNRFINLRPATWSQNSINAKRHRDNTSGYKGVCFAKTREKWKACINIDKKRKHLGYFSTAVEAAIAYNEAAAKHYGEFAYLNEIS